MKNLMQVEQKDSNQTWMGWAWFYVSADSMSVPPEQAIII